MTLNSTASTSFETPTHDTTNLSTISTPPLHCPLNLHQLVQIANFLFYRYLTLQPNFIVFFCWRLLTQLGFCKENRKKSTATSTATWNHSNYRGTSFITSYLTLLESISEYQNATVFYRFLFASISQFNQMNDESQHQMMDESLDHRNIRKLKPLSVDEKRAKNAERVRKARASSTNNQR